MILEACVENVDQAIIAEENGAHRLELCSHLELDGLSPSIDLIKSTLKATSIPIKVMVRNRPGHFIYTDRDMEEMIQYCKMCSTLPIDGFVTGMIDDQNQIDIQRFSTLLSEFPNHNFTFHKAIDIVKNPISELKKCTHITNLTHVLTSGGKMNAVDGSEILKAMVEYFEPGLKIIAAGRITRSNILEIQNATGVSEFHGKNLL